MPFVYMRSDEIEEYVSKYSNEIKLILEEERNIEEEIKSNEIKLLKNPIITEWSWFYEIFN